MASVQPSSAKRRKRTPEEARLEALAAARILLLEGGPDAVTLKAVGEAIGVSHANVIHHFGSAAGLQSALMGAMVQDLAAALMEVVDHVRSDDAAFRRLVDMVFDAFAQGGAGYLAAWIALSGDLSRLDPVREAVRSLVVAIQDKFVDLVDEDEAVEKITSALLFIALSAFGDAVIGAPLRGMLGREPDAVRKIVAQLLPSFLV